MTRVVYKYEVPISMKSPVEIEMPRGSKTLKVGLQGNKAYIWALVYYPEEEPLVTRRFIWLPTGVPCPEHLSIPDYIGSIHPIEMGTEYVFHLFETG